MASDSKFHFEESILKFSLQRRASHPCARFAHAHTSSTRNASKNETAVEPQLRKKATFFWAKVKTAVTRDWLTKAVNNLKSALTAEDFYAVPLERQRPTDHAPRQQTRGLTAQRDGLRIAAVVEVEAQPLVALPTLGDLETV